MLVCVGAHSTCQVLIYVGTQCERVVHVPSQKHVGLQLVESL